MFTLQEIIDTAESANLRHLAQHVQRLETVIKETMKATPTAKAERADDICACGHYRYRHSSADTTVCRAEKCNCGGFILADVPVNRQTISRHDELILRRLVACNHGCPPSLYTDDGEMNCPHCKTDFLRCAVSEIEATVMRNGEKRLREYEADPNKMRWVVLSSGALENSGLLDEYSKSRIDSGEFVRCGPDAKRLRSSGDPPYYCRTCGRRIAVRADQCSVCWDARYEGDWNDDDSCPYLSVEHGTMWRVRHDGKGGGHKLDDATRRKIDAGELKRCGPDGKRLGLHWEDRTQSPSLSEWAQKMAATTLPVHAHLRGAVARALDAARAEAYEDAATLTERCNWGMTSLNYGAGTPPHFLIAEAIRKRAMEKK